MSTEKVITEFKTAGTILVVEDDPGIATLERRSLERVGYTVVTVATADGAMERIVQGDVDLIVLDYVLPGGVSGLEFYRRLKEAGYDLPVVMVTGQSNEATVIEALRAGVQDFVTKSVEYLDYLPEAVGRVLTQARTERFLEESEQRYKSLFEHNPDAVYSFDLEGNFLSGNPACEKISGYTVEELLQMSFVPLTVEEDLERTRQHFEKAVKGEPQNYEIAIIHKDGHRVELNITNTPIVVEGEIIGVYGIAKDVTERKRAEEALHRQNEYLGALHETALALIDRLELADLLKAIVARAGALMDTPHGFIYLLKSGELEMRVGVGIYEGYVSYRLKPGEGLSGQVLESGQPLVVDDYRTWRGGSPKFDRDVSRAVAGVPLKSGSEEVVGVIGLAYTEEGRTFEDDELVLLSRFAELASLALDNAQLYDAAQQELAERKQAEEALRQSEERYRTILQEIEDGYFELDIAGNFTFFNDSVCRMLGYSRDELIGMNNREYMAQESAKKVYRHFNRVYRTGEPLKGFDWELTKKDGSKLFVETSVSLMRDSEGEPVGFRSIIRDISERKRAEEALRRSEERYRAVVERTTDGIFLADFETKTILESNATLQEMLGYTSEELRGMSLYDVIATDPEVINRNIRNIQEERRYFIGERRYRRKDGSLASVETSAIAIPYEGKEALCYIVRDITERKRAEEELQEANRRMRELAVLKADFTAMVAHELSSPLAAIRGYVDMLTTGKLDPDGRFQALSTIRKQAGMLSTLVADVQAAANVERADFAVQPRPVPLEELLADTTAFARTLPGDHPLIEKVAATHREVWADRERIGQVLRNLLSNAAKYSPAGTPIELRAMFADDGSTVRIEVANRGPGIHPDDAVRIFEKFGRGRDRSGQKVAGVGLGLYLSRRIVQAHGGELTLDSTPGEGSVFGFELKVVG